VRANQYADEKISKHRRQTQNAAQHHYAYSDSEEDQQQG
jgi:hypothetical protein